jgi:hypothetical protein
VIVAVHHSAIVVSWQWLAQSKNVGLGVGLMVSAGIEPFNISSLPNKKTGARPVFLHTASLAFKRGR